MKPGGDIVLHPVHLEGTERGCVVSHLPAEAGGYRRTALCQSGVRSFGQDAVHFLPQAFLHLGGHVQLSAVDALQGGKQCILVETER